jgi:tetratricopeptide (TPR) repeat protein
MLAPLRAHILEFHPASVEELRPVRTHFLAIALRGDELGREGGAEASVLVSTEYPNAEWSVGLTLDDWDLGEAIPAARALAEFTRFTGLGGSGLLARAEALARELGDRLGEANCIQALGHIALARSDHAEARRRFEEAQPIYRELGDRLGEANCIYSLGNIALARSDHAEARRRFEEALKGYRSIPEPYSMGNVLRRLALVTPDRKARQALLGEAVQLWESIDRPDLVAQLRAEFPGEC